MSRRLMLLEQLVTAGTTTGICLRLLIRKYKTLLRTQNRVDSDQNLAEQGRAKTCGKLAIWYFAPGTDSKTEPVKSHLKLTMVDGEVAVFGSGNLDRASWWTSQELGLALTDSEVVRRVRAVTVQVYDSRKEVVYPKK